MSEEISRMSRLVVSRKVGESVIIPGSNMRITAVRVGDGKVRLSFDAPADLLIIREEMHSEERNGKLPVSLRNSRYESRHGDSVRE